MRVLFAGTNKSQKRYHHLILSYRIATIVFILVTKSVPCIRYSIRSFNIATSTQSNGYLIYNALIEILKGKKFASFDPIVPLIAAFLDRAKIVKIVQT